MTTVLLSLGSNVRPAHHLTAAVAALRGQFHVTAVSAAYRTAAVGFQGPDFLNAGVALRTDWSLSALEDWLHALEEANGRDRHAPRYVDRTLDLDVVFYGDLCLQRAGKERLPRPERVHAFVLRPLADIAPGFIDPTCGQPLSQLWQAHADHRAPLDALPLDGSVELVDGQVVAVTGSGATLG